MTDLFTETYRNAVGTETELVEWVCTAEDHDAGGLFSYWGEPSCSVCGEKLDRRHD